MNLRERDIVDKDRKEFPNCSYSLSFSNLCRSEQGCRSVCEISRNLIRLCPGKQSTTIHSLTEKYSGDYVDSNPWFHKDQKDSYQNFQFRNEIEDIEMMSPFQLMERMWSQFAADQDPKREMRRDFPPHKFPKQENHFRDKLEITGPVEDI